MSPEPRVGGQAGGIFCGTCMQKVYGSGVLAPGQHQPRPQEAAEVKIGVQGP